MYNTTDITFKSKLPSLCLFVKINIVFNDWPIKKTLREMQVARGCEVVWYLFEWACVFQICREWIFKKHISKKSVVSDKKSSLFLLLSG